MFTFTHLKHIQIARIAVSMKLSFPLLPHFIFQCRVNKSIETRGRIPSHFTVMQSHEQDSCGMWSLWRASVGGQDLNLGNGRDIFKLYCKVHIL